MVVPAVLPGYGAPLRAVHVYITVQEGGEEAVYRSLSNAYRSLSNVPTVYTATVGFIDARSAQTAPPQEPKDSVMAALIECITGAAMFECSADSATDSTWFQNHFQSHTKATCQV